MIKKLKHNLALKLDSIGFIASTLCAIHCAAMPFIIIFLTVYGFQFIANPVVEYLFIGSSVLIGIFTFTHGYFNHHRKLYPGIIFISGLLIILTGHFIFHDHNHLEHFNADEMLYFMIAPAGAFLIGLSHYLNRKLTKYKNSKVCSC